MYSVFRYEWWQNLYYEAKCLLSSSVYVSAIRTIGVFTATLFVISNTPKWMKFAMDQHHFLGLNVVLLVAIFLFRIWKKYSADINISIFRFFRYGFQKLKLFVEIYLSLDPTTPNYEELYRRRQANRKFIRTGVIFVLMQYCIIPNGHLIWVEALVSFKFIKDISMFVRSNERGSLNIFSSTDGQSTEGDRRAQRNEIVVYAFKLVVSALILYKLLLVSFIYLTLTAVCYSLINRTLEQPLTKTLEYFQFDTFEGLEQFYVTGFLGFIEVLLSFVFMTWTLILHNQYLMLIALYTNVYMTCKEVIHGAITSALAEWFLLVQFNRASAEELKRLDDVCSVCLSSMTKARKTKCNHFFHGHCLRRCLKEKNSCPFCNQPLIS